MIKLLFMTGLIYKPLSNFKGGVIPRPPNGLGGVGRELGPECCDSPELHVWPDSAAPQEPQNSGKHGSGTAKVKQQVGLPAALYNSPKGLGIYINVFWWRTTSGCIIIMIRPFLNKIQFHFLRYSFCRATVVPYRLDSELWLLLLA